jgi:DNA-binding NtrC family response regulator
MRGIVLVVDDRARPRRALATELGDAGFEVVEAADGAEAWERFCERPPDVVITDLVMPRSDGLDLLSRIRSRSDVPVILFTARGSVASAASAFKAGADDFVSSPDVGIDELVDLVARAARGSHPAQILPALETHLVGSSRAMRRLRERISGLAPLMTPVLVAGEPGTGRDSVVHALNQHGATAGSDLVRIDTRAFTPAGGVPDAAAVYLDGIELLSSEAQTFWAAKVAAAEAGGFQSRPRILASAAEPFVSRDAVYPELRSVLLRFSVEIPPLRTIAEDVPAIADALVGRIGESVGRRIRLSPSASEFLAAQRWPGNVRQLEQVLQRSVAFSRGRQIRREVVRDILSELEESVASIREQRSAIERDALLRAIQGTGGNVTHAAEILGKSRSAIYRLIEKHGIALTKERE